MITGPNMANDGLVFYYDTVNTRKSFLGEPTENMSYNSDEFSQGGNMDNIYGDWLYQKASIISSNNNNPITNLNNVHKLSLTNTSWDLYRRFNNIISGTIYTFSLYVKLGTATNFCITVNNSTSWNSVKGQEFTIGTDGLNTESYTRISITFTGPTSNAINIHLGGHSETMTQQTLGTIFLCNHQLETKGHATQYLRTPGLASVSRSATESLLDMTASNTPLDMSTVSYDSNAQPFFDGVDDKIAGNWPTQNKIDDNVTPRTWEVIVNPTSTISQGIFGLSANNGCSYYCNGGIFIWGGNWVFNWFDNTSYRWLSSGITPEIDKYTHIVCTVEIDGIPRIYVNGELKATHTESTFFDYSGGEIYYDIGWNSMNNYFFGGEIPMVKFYKNNALTPLQVKQNFNAFKSRFGI